MADIPNNYYRTSIKALILDEKKRFLLFLEDNGKWELPGGGLDFGEKPQDCLIRELKEEAGMDVTSVKDQPSYFITALHTNNTWKSNVLYEVKVRNLEFIPTDECIDLKFFRKEEALNENLNPIVREFVKVYTPENHS